MVCDRTAKMNDFYYEAGTKIRLIRESMGYSRDYLAEIADISSKFLYEIETGRKGFSAETLFRLAEALNIRCEDIIGKTNATFNAKVEVEKSMKNLSVSQIEFLEEIIVIIQSFIS